MKKRVFQLICVCFPLMLQAQKKDCGCRFSSINQIGLLEGSSLTSYQMQSINGIGLNTWFMGIGVGLDRYRFTTIPVFFDLRKNFSKKPNSAFFYGDLGVHLPWVRDKEKEWFGKTDYNRGLYYDMGLGYNVDIGKKRALLFSGGISLKKIRETRNFEVACVTFPCPEIPDRYDFTLKRFSVKAGIRL